MTGIQIEESEYLTSKVSATVTQKGQDFERNIIQVCKYIRQANAS